MFTDAAATAALIISIGAIVFAGLQWKAAERSADAAEESAKIADATMKTTRQIAQTGQRPWVSLINTTVNEVREAQEPVLTIHGRFTFRNGGTTPAVHLTIQSDRKFLEAFAECNISYPPVDAQETSNGVLGPGEDCGIPFQLHVSSKDLATYATKNMQLFTYGQACYADIFGESHMTTFCMQYYPKDKQFSFHSRYNDIT